MKKDAIIKIVSVRNVDGELDTYEMSVTGTISHNGTQSIIEYFENDEETGPQQTTVTVFDDSTVGIIRQGAFGSEMTVEKGVRHQTFYKTPYGEMTMGIYGSQVNWFRNGIKSVLKMKYSLDFNNGLVSENSMNIYIEEK